MAGVKPYDRAMMAEAMKVFSDAISMADPVKQMQGDIRVLGEDPNLNAPRIRATGEAIVFARRFRIPLPPGVKAGMTKEERDEEEKSMPLEVDQEGIESREKTGSWIVMACLVLMGWWLHGFWVQILDPTW